MDDKDNFITVSHNTDNQNLSEPLPETNETQESSAENSNETAAEIDQQVTANKKYDDFMYEPIGFEELEHQQESASNSSGAAAKKRHRSFNEKIIIILLTLIFIVTVLLAVFAVIKDISNSDKAFAEYTNPGNVIVYKKPQPVSADDKDYLDQNGKYTTVGIAALVRPSIVEIYTYSDIQHQTLVNTGSGVVISEDGYIVTNAHVLQADGYHTITTSDDNVYDAKIIGRDAKTDIAIIKVNNAKLQPAVLGDSDEVVVGEQVMAIGNPAGLSGSVTDGIVSAVNRKIKSDSTGFEMNCIQTNADISPGNSGGALVNMYGQVIGITSSKYVSSSYEGLGFAITINDVMPIINELISQGYVSGRFKVGIELIGMDNEYSMLAIKDALGFDVPEDFSGIYILSIDEDCDIANTELKSGDFITAINGKSVKNYSELYDAISGMYSAGDKVPATCAHVLKNGNIEYYEIEFELMEDKSGNY